MLHDINFSCNSVVLKVVTSCNITFKLLSVIVRLNESHINRTVSYRCCNYNLRTLGIPKNVNFHQQGISIDDNSATSAPVFGKAAPVPARQVVTKHTMRDFLGLENSSEETKKAMMDFSYLSTIGNMDEAFKAIKLIKR